MRSSIVSVRVRAGAIGTIVETCRNNGIPMLIWTWNKVGYWRGSKRNIRPHEKGGGSVVTLQILIRDEDLVLFKIRFNVVDTRKKNTMRPVCEQYFHEA